VLETRFDTILPTLATKADVREFDARIDLALMKLRVDLMKAMREQTKWLTGLVIVAVLGMLGFSVHVSNRLPPASAVTTPAPPAPSVSKP